jgi:outer membrane receptor protein involved in Fe transport
VELAPRGSVAWQVAAPLSVHASVGRGFRAPALIEIACADPQEPCPLPFALGDDPPIDPVRVLTYEAGARYLNQSLGVQGVVYRSDVSDDIFLFPYEDANEPAGSTIDGYFGNVPRTRRTGAELNLQLQLTRGTRAYASYALTRATFQSDEIEIFSIREVAGAENEVEAGDRFPLVPAFTLGLGADTNFRGIEIGVSGNVIGRRFLRGDEANDEEPLPSYATMDARAGYVLGEWRFDILVRNATDTRHSSFGGFNVNQGAGGALERFLTPGGPRRVQLGVRRSF